jgi:hypothetical protein
VSCFARGPHFRWCDINRHGNATGPDAVRPAREGRGAERAFSELARLELQGEGGMSLAKVIGLDLASGAGAILTRPAFMAVAD